jgi:hypothetical protein
MMPLVIFTNLTTLVSYNRLVVCVKVYSGLSPAPHRAETEERLHKDIPHAYADA